MKNKIIMLTAYDYPTAKILDKAGIDYILVGDSLGMVVLGYKDTKSVTLDEMLHHTRAVARGSKNTFVIGDMPIGTYEETHKALENAKMFLKAGAKGVKIEGYKPEIIKILVESGIPVIGHLGLLPQTALEYKVQGKILEDADKIYNDALKISKLGIKLLVLECIPGDLAKKITENIEVPTIGIGSGPDCSGQVLVLHDLIGLSDFQGKFIKRYANVKEEIRKAVESFRDEVSNGEFPAKENTF